MLTGIFIQAQKVTYNNDIAPIIEKNCSVCHYSNGPTPFPLMKYEDVAKRAKFISYVTEQRIMPPWKANPDYVHFSNERMLKKEDIELIKKWVEGGSKKGSWFKKAELNSIRKDLGKPDLELKMAEPIQIVGNNQNTYHCYKIPFELDQDTFGKVFEFIPDNIEVLHHATFQILSTSESAKIFEPPFQLLYNSENFMDDGGFYKAMNLVGEDGEFPEVVYGNSWLPGSTVQIMPEEMGFNIPKKGVIFFNYIHYSPSPIDQSDLSGINLYFSESKPQRIIHEQLFKPNFKGLEGILPKDSVKVIKFEKYLKNKISIFTVIPHMHRLGKYFKAYAVNSKGDTIPLVEVKDWDFNWQEYYRYKKPVVLDRGTHIHAEAIFDNTKNNLSNPFDPPREIYFNDSMDEESEMMHLIFLYSSYEPGDEQMKLRH